MRIFYCDHFPVRLPESHRFPLPKYARLRERVEESEVGRDATLEVPGAASDQALQSVHEQEYVRKVRDGLLTEKEIRRMGFPWSPALVERSRRSVGGTLEAGRAALEEGVAVNLSGGTHHAFPGHGEGYCVFNDVGVAARVLHQEAKTVRVAILDLDVHQGNGTAAIFRDDPSVFTLSVHGANNFPFQKEPGNLDLELPDGAADDEYLTAVESGVQRALEASEPDLAFFLAGADPYTGDRLGRLAVTKEGLRTRDRLVFDSCSRAGVPVAVTMGGGYAPRVEDTVEIHLETVRAAARFSEGWSS
jgi:acetoin utilization deacetylase AcuC-like enzyme